MTNASGRSRRRFYLARARLFAIRLVCATVAVLAEASNALGQLRPEPTALAVAPPQLMVQLRASPYAYFRFVNRPWIARVCEIFAEEARTLPIVRLHGDAHLEQFAVTRDAWGLDDFDDSVRGPEVIDIVRFVGSIDLATRQRGWTLNREALIDRFFAGYKQGLAHPDDYPRQPAIVGRIRAERTRSRAEFLAWGEAQMEPLEEEPYKTVLAGVDTFARLGSQRRPELPPDYFQVVRAGWLRTGVGSATTYKILVRLRGPSADPADDELLEAKQLRYLGGLGCLEEPSEAALRVIVGARQIGRLKHNILMSGPEVQVPEILVRTPGLRDWWIRSWDPSYREVHVNDLRSVQDLAAIVYDSGVQLGVGSIEEKRTPDPARKQAFESIARLEKRIRQETANLVEELLLGWKELGAR